MRSLIPLSLLLFFAGTEPIKPQLSETELKKVKEIHYKTQKKIIEIKSKIELKELELRHLLESETPKENEIYSLVKEIGNLKTQMRMEKIKSILEIRKILPKEKWKLFKRVKGPKQRRWRRRPEREFMHP